MNDWNSTTLDEWYPTPVELAIQMADLIDWKKVNAVLDPSAGKGDLIFGALCSEVNGFSRWRMYPSFDIFAIEIDPQFRCILNNIKLGGERNSECKEINVIGSDFLKYRGEYAIDCIIMNPPFSNGDEHLLKALDIIICDGGQIVCVLNQETIDNPYSAKRQLLKNQIDKYNAEITYIGKAFSSAFRKASVNCVLVKFNIPKKVKKVGYFSDMTTLTEDDFNTVKEQNGIVTSDKIAAEIARYKHEVEIYKNILENISELEQYGGQKAFEKRLSINDFIKKATVSAWEKLIAYPKFTRFMTRKTLDSFRKQIHSQHLMEFTEDNILQFLDALVFSYKDIMVESVTDIFDHFCRFDKRNTVAVEGWLTNDAYKVNKTVIIPYIWSYGSLKWETVCILNDIDRIMMWISGEWLDDINNPTGDTDLCPRYVGGIVETINNAKDARNAKRYFGVLHESYFFNFRLYQKPQCNGTIHLTFKNSKLLEAFNIQAASGKKWLPDDYKSRYKKYKKDGRLLEEKK